MKNSLLMLAPAIALCLLALASAVGAEPADRNAPAPALRYRSAFADYKPWRDIKPGDWRAVNDGVRDAATHAGGHAGPAMPAGLPPAASAPKASAPAASAGQGGHHGAKPCCD